MVELPYVVRIFKISHLDILKKFFPFFLLFFLLFLQLWGPKHPQFGHRWSEELEFLRADCQNLIRPTKWFWIRSSADKIPAMKFIQTQYFFCQFSFAFLFFTGTNNGASPGSAGRTSHSSFTELAKPKKTKDRYSQSSQIKSLPDWAKLHSTVWNFVFPSQWKTSLR